MSSVSLSAIDKKILAVLQDNARIPNTELADAVSLTPSPCLRRVQRLEETGVIDGYVALLNHEAVGRNFHVFVEVTLQTQTKESIDRFEKEVTKFPEVLECYLVTGESDYLLRVAVADMGAYQRFLMDRLTRVRGVDDIKSVIAMKQVKYSTKLPLD
jgi:Lrp/AsnC family leucine-responsive transcriptional regulator